MTDVESIRLLLGPNDEPNKVLLDRVCPESWANPNPKAIYNLVVIGGGTAGLVAAVGAAGLGAHVALIENELLGGDCLNFGCVPSKAFIESARQIAASRKISTFGARLEGTVHLDFPAVLQRMRRLRADLSINDSADRLKRLGIDFFSGTAAFVASDRVAVGHQTLRFRKAVIATGARPTIPAISGIESVNYLTNRTLFRLPRLPKRMAILGCGPIGCEMAQCFADFGTRVTLIGRGDRILRRESKEASDRIAVALRKSGCELLLNTQVASCSQDSDGVIQLRITTNGMTAELACDELLVATGRTPNLEKLDLPKANIACDTEGRLKINDRLQTTNRRVFAAGDVALPMQFTHAADFSSRMILRNAFFFGRSSWKSLLIPHCTYTSPELAQVGFTEQEAKRKSIRFEKLRIELEQNDRTMLAGESAGFIELLLKPNSDRILGATIVADFAGEMINVLTLAIQKKIGLRAIAGVIHPYPTRSDAIRRLGDLYQRTRLTPSVSAWLAMYFRMIRGT